MAALTEQEIMEITNQYIDKKVYLTLLITNRLFQKNIYNKCINTSTILLYLSQIFSSFAYQLFHSTFL